MYYSDDFHHVLDISEGGYQLSKIRSLQFDIICTYRSTNPKKEAQIDFLKSLNSLLDVKRKTLILGDFNFNALSEDRNIIIQELENWNFTQMVKGPTHIQGGLIDHCYISDNINISTMILHQKSVYYSDHDAISLKV